MKGYARGMPRRGKGCGMSRTRCHAGRAGAQGRVYAGFRGAIAWTIHVAPRQPALL